MVDLPITKWIKKKIRRLIAIVEDTDVATHSIASGKYVVWKGDLHKATAPIAVGGSLSLSNLSPVSDGGLNELSEHIGWKEKMLTTPVYASTIGDFYETSAIPELATAKEIIVLTGTSAATYHTEFYLVKTSTGDGASQTLYSYPVNDATYNAAYSVRWEYSTNKLHIRQGYKGANAGYSGIKGILYR